MVAPSKISYDCLHTEWLDNKAWKKMCKNAKHIGVIDIGRRFCLKLLDDAFEKEISIVEVNYTDSKHYHVAMFLYRKKHPDGGPTLEYIDSMAHPKRDRLQNFFEKSVYEYCAERNVRYIGSEHMYNGVQSDYEYNWEPPLCLQNLLTNNQYTDDFKEYKKSLEKYHAAPMSNKLDSREFVKELQSFSGGNCKFWSYLIAEDLIENQISSRRWMHDFRQDVEQAPESVSMYIVMKLLAFF